MCASLVEIRSVTQRSSIEKKAGKKKERKKTTAVKYNPFGIEMSCELKKTLQEQ